ncbi:hypothetical protein V8C43DRAFT_284189, partial [Trichoderma afarasin]
MSTVRGKWSVIYRMMLSISFRLLVPGILFSTSSRQAWCKVSFCLSYNTKCSPVYILKPYRGVYGKVDIGN